MNYVTYDEAGKLTGSYQQDLLPEHADNHIVVTDEQRLSWVLYRANAARDGLEIAPPVVLAPAVPQQVTMRQARLALWKAGLLARVPGIIDAMSSPHKEAAQIEWESSQTVERHRPLVQSLGPSLGLNDAAIDQLFITAATL